MTMRAGVEAKQTDVNVRLGANGLVIEQLAVADFGGAALAVKGRIGTKAQPPRGALTLDLDARALDGVTAALEKFAPQAAEQLRGSAGRLTPLALRASLAVEPSAPGATAANGKFKIVGRAGAFRVALEGDAGAAGDALKLDNLASLTAAKVNVSARLEGEDGAALVELIGLDRREPDGTPSIEKHIVDIYKKVQARFPDKKIVIGETGWPSDGRMRSDARPGRIEQVRYFSTFRTIAEREKFDYNVVEAFDQYWKARQEGTVGAAWGLLDAQRQDKFELGKPVVAEPHWRMLFTLSTLAGGLVLMGFVSLRRQARGKTIAIFAVFAQVVATCYMMDRVKR